MNNNLLAVLQQVTEWLKFAEAKNTGLIAFNGASIFGIVALLGTTLIEKNPAFWWWGVLSIILLMISTMIALFSMVPQLNIIKEGVGIVSIPEQKQNRVYFEHIRTLTSEKVYENITNEKFDKASPLNKDLAVQIIQISKIASKKYSHFTIAVWFTLFGIIFPIAILLFIKKMLELIKVSK